MSSETLPQLHQQQDILRSTDKDAVRELALNQLRTELDSAADNGAHFNLNITQEVFELYDNGTEMCKTPEGEAEFVQKFDALPQQERDTYNRLILIRGLVSEVSNKIALANTPDDAEHNPFHTETMVALQRESGMTAREVENFFSNTVNHDISTPHPTQYLSTTGIELKRLGNEIGEMPEDRRAGAMQTWIKRLVQADNVALTEKATSIDSLDAEVAQKQINQAGRHSAYQRLQNAYDVQWKNSDEAAPNIYSRRTRMKHAEIGWAAGGDRDGKDPSERWIDLAGKVTKTSARATQLLEILDRADIALKCQSGELTMLQANWVSSVETTENRQRNVDARLAPLYDSLTQIRNRLHDPLAKAEDGMTLFQKTRHVVEELARSQPEDRAEMYMQELPYFEKARAQFNDLYVGMPHPENSPEDDKHNGMGFYRFMYRQLEELHETIDDATAQDAIREMIGLVKNEGMTVSLTEERNNAFKSLEAVMNNLFTPRKDGFAETHIFPNAKEFSKGEIDALASLNKDKVFSDLPEDIQKSIMDKAQRIVPADVREQALWDANPFKLNDSGYPSQDHETLQLLDMRRDFPFKYAPKGVTAEAQPLSPLYQLFMTNSFGLETITPTPLAEDYDSLKTLPQNLIEASETELYQLHMDKRTAHANNHLDNIETQTSRSLGSMVPCSDVIRQLGPLGKVLQFNVVQDLMRASIEADVPGYDTWGNGASIARNVGDVMIPRRFKAQVAKAYVNEHGPLNPNKAQDINILKSVLYTSNTTQGRSNQEQFPTPKAYERIFLDQLAEKTGMYLELTGRVKGGDFVMEPEYWSDNVLDFVQDISDQCMRHYSDFRDARSEDSGKRVSVEWSESYSNMAGSSDTQKGDRPAGKGKTKTFHNVRAIQSTVITALSRAKQDGHFTYGMYEEEKHARLQDGRLSKSDLRQIESSPLLGFFQNTLALTEATRAQPEHGFETKGLGKQWDFDTVMSPASDYELVHTVKEDGSRDIMFKFDDQNGEMSAADVFHAALIKDRIKFLAFTEAKYRDSKDVNYNASAESIIKAMRPADGSLRISTGELTIANNPHIAGVKAAADAERPTLAVMDHYKTLRENAVELSPHSAALAAMAYRGHTQLAIAPILNRELAYGRPMTRDWSKIEVTPEPWSGHKNTLTNE